VTPRQGRRAGNLVVDVFGRGFAQRPGGLVCAFGDGPLALHARAGKNGAAAADNIAAAGAAAPPSVVVVDAELVSPTHLRCVVPPAELLGGGGEGAPRSVAVRVACDGRSFSPRRSAQRFAYLDPVAVARVLPALGPDRGGTLVQLEGSGFQPLVPYVCVFGPALSSPAAAAAAAAVFESATLLTCVSPPASAGSRRVLVSLSVDGHDVTAPDAAAAEPATFAYYPTPRLTEVYPPGGPIGGGTDVELLGDGIDVSGLLAGETALSPAAVSTASSAPMVAWCRFGVKVVPAFRHFTNGSRSGGSAGSAAATYRITCESPSWEEAMGWAGLVSAAATSSRSGFGGGSGANPLSVPVDVSLNGVDFSPAPASAAVSAAGAAVAAPPASAAYFTYHRRLVVASVAPATGPTSGGTRVTLAGANFPTSTSLGGLRCRFGARAAALTAATVLSADRLVCSTPPWPLSASLAAAGSDAASGRGKGDGFVPWPEPFRAQSVVLVPDVGGEVETGFGFTYHADLSVNSLSPAAITEV
jgi:hypothetical protein